ncbi:MAG TPA: sugar phosphate isomerase/epimerase [Terriglobales bacterium]|nr:sugar phosphate isomerase/epimerase [Terriglobales bacterium]
MMNRRTFLGTVTAATLLARRFSWAATEHKLEKIGLQLYTVRDLMKGDFEGTIAQVAAIGYAEVEFAGYFGRSPQDIRSILDRNGLTSPSTHVDYEVLGDKWPKEIETSQVIGQSYIICPWIPEEVRNQPDGWRRAAETFNRAGEVSKQAGIQFGYHNHWFEFYRVNGKRPYDLLLEECDPNLVAMEMDLCWIEVGGGDPLDYFNRYPGRFPLVHVKDVKEIPTAKESGGQDFGSSLPGMTEVGSGVIDWKKIFAQSDKAGIKHYIVEHDNPKAPFDSIRTSFNYLRQLRF